MEDSKISAIAEVQTKLGHELIKIYSPAYYLIDSLINEEGLSDSQILIMEMVRTSMAAGIFYTPTTMNNELMPSTMQGIVDFSWHLWVLQEVFPEYIDPEHVKEYYELIEGVWTPPNKFIVTSGIDLFNLFNSCNQGIIKIRVTQLVIELISRSINRLNWPIGMDSFPMWGKINYILESVKGLKENPSCLHVTGDKGFITLELTTLNPCKHYDKDFLWKSYGLMGGLETLCEILYVSLRKTYNRDDVLSCNLTESGFKIKCCLDISH